MKLALIVGMLAGWHSWQLVLWAGVVPFLLGGPAALAMLVARRADRQTMIAFGPFILFGAAMVVTLARFAEA